MIYKTGTKITCKDDGRPSHVTASGEKWTFYIGDEGQCPGYCETKMLVEFFDIDGVPLPTVAEAMSALDVQEGGDHYKTDWEVLRRWLTPEEFRGYMKGTAIAYLAREQDKGGVLDIRKAGHTLQGLVELLGG